jgi:hypothetical protein
MSRPPRRQPPDPLPPEQKRTEPALDSTWTDTCAASADCSPNGGESRYRPAASEPARLRTRWSRTGMTADQIRDLPAAVPFDPVVPAAFGISRSAAYRALAAGQLPITPLRLGRKLIVTWADLLAALGIEDRSAASGPAATATSNVDVSAGSEVTSRSEGDL